VGSSPRPGAGRPGRAHPPSTARTRGRAARPAGGWPPPRPAPGAPPAR
jgi:hypothetical protein